MGVELTRSSLYSKVARNWHQQDDIAPPFKDRRWSHVKAIWTFDLDGDILRLDKADRKLWVTLDLVRQRSINLSDFEPCQPQLTLTKHAL